MRPSDFELAELLRSGDPGAFEPFVERFGPLVMNFGHRMCGQREDAEEVLQETLLKAYLSLKDLREPGAIRTWVYRVAANACLRMRRRGKFEPRQEVSLDEVLPSGDDVGSPPQVADWSDLPLARLLEGELREKLEQAVLELPQDYRAVLVLRDQEGLDTRETAEILGITESLAKVRLHRARLALRKALADYFAERPPNPKAR